MLWTPHLLAGAAIAAKISNPFLALPLALLSHYFLDSFPQEEYSITNIFQKRWNNTFLDFLKVFLDFSLGITLILLLSGAKPIILIAAFLAIAPDGITFLNLFLSNKLIKQHQKLHKAINYLCAPMKKNKKIYRFLGVFSQVAVIATAILFLR